ncbi:MAG: hypothetical protein EAY75_01960 [Bacteroidetes bacterium]|nr:MAG: hypothetical protein EAY75_01960 [Bacteroidota bacterium]
MLNYILGGCCCIWCVLTGYAQPKRTMDVYLIGGQSNATGQGIFKNIPPDFFTDTAVHFFYGNGLQGVGKPMQWGPLSQASETNDKFGVELSLGTTLQQYYPNRQIGLIKYAFSGSNLYSQWAPGSHKADTNNYGAEFKKFVLTVDAALAQLKAKGIKPRLRGMVWIQGEADAREIAGSTNAEAYGKNLNHFIQRVREQWQVPNLPFLYAYVIPVPQQRFTGREEVRRGQQQVDRKSGNSLSVKNAFAIPTDDLQLRADDINTPFPDDKVHFGTLGVWELGKRFAKQLKRK